MNRNDQQQQCNNAAHLRKVLNVMFPPSYIQLYHKPPNSVCSLLQTRCWPKTGDDTNLHQFEASTEPSSRNNLITLRKQFNESLLKHQAKLAGLCPIRRAIYDQCFDELIRQVTVGCIEQGLLLFRIRNELRMTLNCFRRAYESGVKFGLSKAIEAEAKLAKQQTKIHQLETIQENFETNCNLIARRSELELKNKLDTVDKMKEYYKNEVVKKNQVIEQQRAIIKALSQKSISDIKSPI